MDSILINFTPIKHQADPVIAHRSKLLLSEIVWSNNTDFVVQNPDCAIANSYQIISRDSMPGKSSLPLVQKQIPTFFQMSSFNCFSVLLGKNVFKMPSCPLFDLEDIIVCRTL